MTFENYVVKRSDLTMKTYLAEMTADVLLLISGKNTPKAAKAKMNLIAKLVRVKMNLSQARWIGMGKSRKY
jgi:hypothetical protein